MEQGEKGGPSESEIARAKEIIQQKSKAIEKESIEGVELQLALHSYSHGLQRAAAISKGEIVPAEAGALPGLPDSKAAAIERNKSVAVQSATALVTSLFSLLWITYIGADAPPEIYAAVAALVPIIGQGVATAINNRKK